MHDDERAADDDVQDDDGLMPTLALLLALFRLLLLVLRMDGRRVHADGGRGVVRSSSARKVLIDSVVELLELGGFVQR